jgi:hypothetical protein
VESSASKTRTYLVECFAPRAVPEDVRAASKRADAASAEMLWNGSYVLYRGALLVASDEVVFHLFEASDIAAVRTAVDRAGLKAERIVESVVIDRNRADTPRVSPPDSTDPILGWT